MRQRKYRYDYYKVDMPAEAFDGDPEPQTRRNNAAIDAAREQARLYVIPCEWQAHGLDNTFVAVRRKRNA